MKDKFWTLVGLGILGLLLFGGVKLLAGAYNFLTIDVPQYGIFYHIQSPDKISEKYQNGGKKAEYTVRKDSKGNYLK